MKLKSDFSKIIGLLQKRYGPPKPPQVTRPLEMILWENVVYLANDEMRALAYEALLRQVGPTARNSAAGRNLCAAPAH